MFSQRSSDAEELQSPAPCLISSQFPGPIYPKPLPSPATAQRNLHPPKPFSVGGIGSPNSPIPTQLRRGPARLQDGPCSAESGPRCPRRYGACGPLLFCPHRTRRAPFFRGFHALAVDDRRTGALLAALKPSNAISKRVMDSLQSPVVPPLLEVHVDRRERGKVLGQHAPSAAATQNIEDGVDDRSELCRTRAPSWLGGREQPTDDPPFRVAEVAGVSHRRILARLSRLSKHPLRQLSRKGWSERRVASRESSDRY